MAVNMLCIRDPDYENSYVFDDEVNEITIDIGGQWNSWYAYYEATPVSGMVEELVVIEDNDA